MTKYIQPIDRYTLFETISYLYWKIYKFYKKKGHTKWESGKIAKGVCMKRSVFSQSVLLVAAFFLDIFLFLLQGFLGFSIRVIRMPPYTREVKNWKSSHV